MNKFIIGLLIGIAIAGGLAVYLNNAPTQFINKNVTAGSNTANQSPMILAPGTKIQEEASGSDAVKPAPRANNTSAPASYDFYDVLQERKASNHAASNPAPAKVAASAPKPDKIMVQAGAFSTEELAADMKGRVALLGIDSTIVQTNGVYRVLIGPLSSDAKAQRIVNQLSDQQINAVLTK